MKVLEELAIEFACEPPDHALERLAEYAELILRWNRRKRIVGSRDPDEILRIHLADALALAGQLQRLETEGQTLLDVGSGAGLPGLALALLIPSLRVSLCEISEKRVAFLHHARSRLQVECEILHQDVFRLEGDGFDHVVSRAVFEPSKWVEVGRRCVLSTGSIWCMLTERQHDPLLGGTLFHYEVAGGRQRILLRLQGPSFT